MATTSKQIKRTIAKRQAAFKNPELDFSAPVKKDAPAVRVTAPEVLAVEELTGQDTTYAPAAQFTYTRASHLFRALELEASKVRGIAAKHKKFVKYDRENPDDYADAGAATWDTPYNVLRTLNESSPEARFVAIEIFSIARWSVPFSVPLMKNAGCDEVHDHVVEAAKRIAVFLQGDSTDLFDSAD
ncbi:hypothetical protein DZC30_02485 [Comamonas testosteroni]|uniref:Uncharacterized protein n=1 Tax=Comamonas testosteroni TaxID=285 RepID=A0A373FR85_COMTE|nr:hypothetical protein [Comamonas testosteroni]RGE46663.1 hypothetical protein DZC30_02485 [Comamonas testosteroni]